MTTAERLDAYFDEFSITFPRSDYHPRQPVTYTTHVHKVGPTPGGHSRSVNGVYSVTIVNQESVSLTGTLEDIRASLDQAELAYDELVNPPPRRDYGPGYTPTMMEGGPT